MISDNFKYDKDKNTVYISCKNRIEITAVTQLD